MSILNVQASRPTTGRRHSKEVMLSHRGPQLGCSNQYGWGSRAEQLCLREQLSKQECESTFEHLLIGPPPGLELCDTCDSSIGNDNSFFSNSAPLAMTTDAISASCGREHFPSDSFFAGRSNQVVTSTNAQDMPKSSLQIRLVDCIDDTSTVASENSPALFPRDLIEGGSAQSSPNNALESTQSKKESPRTLPSLAEALNFEPRNAQVPSLVEALVTPKNTRPPSLAEALNFGTPTVTPKAKAPISLEAMLELSPLTKQEDVVKSTSTWNPSQAPLGMVPLGGMCPWWLSNFPALRGPLPAGGAGYPEASNFWPAAGSWGQPMNTNNIPGVRCAGPDGPQVKVDKASSRTTDSSEVFQI